MGLHIDLETCSVVDLRRTGVYRYAEDPETHVICACFKMSGDPDVEVWVPGMPVPPSVTYAVGHGVPIHAWNAQFEAAMWDGVLGPRHGWPSPRPDQFDCTMARAMYWGWPASLDMAGTAMGLSIRKDKEGHALMLRMARPRGFDAMNKPIWWHQTDSAKLAREIAYCQQDVLAEDAVFNRLPELPPVERRLWLLDQKMNRRGLPVDMQLVRAMQRVSADAEKAIREAMKQLTNGAVSGPQSHAALAQWLTEQGLRLPDLRADTVKTTLRTLSIEINGLDNGTKRDRLTLIRDVLILRRDGAKASVAKLKAFAEAVCSDGNVKGMLRYYGAGRTGRWSGAGGAKVQPHNLVRGTIKRPDQAIGLILSGHNSAELELLFEDSALGVIASCLRGCFACQ